MSQKYNSVRLRAARAYDFLLRLWMQAAYIGLPALIILALAYSLSSLPSYYQNEYARQLSVRFLPDDSGLALEQARAQLDARSARLFDTLPEGRSWLLAGISDSPSALRPDHQVLLLPVNGVRAIACWLLTRSVAAVNQSGANYLPISDIQSGLLGQQLRIPANTSATQIICSLDLVAESKASLQTWSGQALQGMVTRYGLAIGVLDGGLLTLAAFLFIIALTMRERPYIILACWIVGLGRIGAWVLGWDHQILGGQIPPDAIFWVRRAISFLFYIATVELFISLYQNSMDTGTVLRLRQAAQFSALVLALALLALPPAWFNLISFLAAWLATALITISMIHGMFRFRTRSELWHTIAASGALLLILVGLVFAALGHRDALEPLATVAVVIVCAIAVALASADQMREERMVRLRSRSELIVHDTLTPLGLFTLGPSRQFEHLNPNARDLLGVGPDADLPAISWNDFFPDTDWEQVFRATEQGKDTELQLLAGDGASPRSFLLRATLAGNRIEGAFQDVSARTESLRQLRLMADNDPLTDTLNRRGIENSLQQSLDALKTSNTPCSLAFLDLDHLRRVNDLFGHSAGDALLQMVCERLKYSLSEQQKLGRISNDEFIILFPGMSARESIGVSRDIIESLNGSALYAGERAFQIKSAMGLIDLGRSMTPRDAIAAASRACRDARKSHQDVMVYEENSRELSDYKHEVELLEKLDSGAESDDIYLEMQPIVSLRHPLQALNFEALLRVRSTPEQPVQTGRFIQAAEESGMVTNIDRWVFTSLLDWLSRHRMLLAHTQQINVNLSGVSLNDDRFMDSLFVILSQQPQFSRRLCIEITEGVALQDMERTRQFMRRLQRMGARVALDDFGAGYTSFSYLKELPADIIKIDGSLIRDMLASDANKAIVNSIVELAHNLGMECIAEWVEDLDTLRALVEMGVDHVQGYVISPARPASEILSCENVLHLVKNPATVKYLGELSRAAH